MSLRTGLILALAYIAPFALLMPPQSTNSPTATFIWFLYPLVSSVVLLAVILIGHHLFDISFTWGAILLIGSPILTLLSSPILSLEWGFYIVPTALAFLVGLLEG